MKTGCLRLGLALALGCVSGLAAWAEPAPPVHTEFYAGVHAGYGQVDTGTDLLEPEGFTGGAQAGVNFWMGKVLLGAEADISAGAVDDEMTDLSVPVTVGLDVDYLASLRGRLGFAATDCITLFGTAGYAWSQANVSLSLPLIPVSLEESVDYEGFVYGGGAEYRLPGNMSLRLEGLHYDLEAQQAGNSDLEIDVVRAGLNYNFH